jgi:hypothetical protein
VGAAYDAWAFGTRYGDKLRRPPAERTPENKVKAISFAAYAALVDLFPARAADFALQMKELGYAVDGSDTSTPATIGAMVAKAVTDFRHKDGSNQLGGYADTTGYQPVNTPDKVVDPWRWEPLRVLLGDPHGTVQKALTPQWATIVPFALSSQFGHDVPGPPRLPNGEFSTEDIETLAKETRRQAVLHPGQRPDGREHRGLGVEVQVRLRAADHRHPRALPGRDIVSWLGPYRGYGLARRSRSTCPATRPSAAPVPGSSPPSSAPTPGTRPRPTSGRSLPGRS